MTREPRAYKPLLFLPVHALMVRWLRHESSRLKLSNWERRFLKDIKRKTKLSMLQETKIREIYNRYRFHKRTILTSSGPYMDVTYDEVHDFDR